MEVKVLLDRTQDTRSSILTYHTRPLARARTPPRSLRFGLTTQASTNRRVYVMVLKKYLGDRTVVGPTRSFLCTPVWYRYTVPQASCNIAHARCLLAARSLGNTECGVGCGNSPGLCTTNNILPNRAFTEKQHLAYPMPQNC